MPERMTDEPRTVVGMELLVLTTEPGQQLLGQIASVAEPSVSDIERWRKHHGIEFVTAALRLAGARRRAAGKFVRSSEMWLDSTGVEQSTDERVARFKAARFRRLIGSEPVIDLCCGVGIDALALAEAGRVIAVDRAPERCRRVHWNLEVYGVGGRGLVVCADAERFGTLEGRWVHIDPDRRAVPGGTGRRARSISDYAPGLPFLQKLRSEAVGGAIKLSPASDFEAHFDDPRLEIELVSLDGECKEATVWFGRAASCRRRATMLPVGATFSDHDGPDSTAALVAAPVDWLYTPDPTLIRAGLLDRFAVKHGLKRAGPGVDWLTGPELESPFLTRYAVQALLPLDFKQLKRELKARQLVPQTIKVRGLDVAPEELRRRLGLDAGRSTTLLLYAPPGGRGRAQVVIGERC